MTKPTGDSLSPDKPTSAKNAQVQQELKDLSTPGLMKTRLYSFEKVRQLVNQAKLEAYSEIEELLPYDAGFTDRFYKLKSSLKEENE